MIGEDAMVATLRKVAQKFPDSAEAALYQEAQLLMTEAKRRTPVDTGKLRASGIVERPVRNGRHISVTLAFGTSYAIFVHEDLTANHASPPFGGGQAKFLESVIDESRDDMADRIARRIDLNQMKVG